VKRSFRLAVLITLALPGLLPGQVGHPPESSPFRDIRTKHSLSLHAAYFGGSGGTVGLIPRDGALAGIRYDIRLGTALEIGVGVASGELERLQIDPNLPPEVRVTGPIQRRMTFWDLNINLLLTGKKSWHRLAPYLSTSLGLAFGGTAPQDTSGFTFNTKFLVSPALGFKLYANERLFFRIEARNVLWRASYPQEFFGFEDDDPVLLIGVDPDSEWTQQPLLIVGLGYAFRY